MALVDRSSCICTKSELDLFTVPPTQTSVEEGITAEFLPAAALSDDGAIDIIIPASGEDYLDLASTVLFVQAKVVQANGDAIANDAPVGPVNLTLHSLFSQVDVKLNDKLVSSSANTYPYRAHLETLLNYGRTAKETQLAASLWYKDTSGQMDSRNAAADGPNAGLAKRAAHVRGDRIVELLGRIHSDMFVQEKLLLNGVNVHVRLVRSSNRFVLMAADDGGFKMKIVKIALRARKVRLAPEVFLAHATTLEKANAKYPIDRVEVKALTVGQGFHNTNEQIFQGQVPTRVIVGLVDTDAFNGRYSKNPFNYKHYSITKVSLQVDGREQMKPLVCDFDNGNAVEAFGNLYSVAGKAFKNEDLDVTREDFNAGYTLFCFDLTPDLAAEAGDHFNLVKTGTVRLAIEFGAALQTTVNAIIYGEFQNVIEIDRNMNVHIDFLG